MCESVGPFTYPCNIQDDLPFLLFLYGDIYKFHITRYTLLIPCIRHQIVSFSLSLTLSHTLVLFAESFQRTTQTHRRTYRNYFSNIPHNKCGYFAMLSYFIVQHHHVPFFLFRLLVGCVFFLSCACAAVIVITCFDGIIKSAALSLIYRQRAKNSTQIVTAFTWARARQRVRCGGRWSCSNGMRSRTK